MSTIGLTPTATSGLDSAVVLLRETQGFLYLPVFVESVLAASSCLKYLQTQFSQQFYNLAWPIDELKTSLIGNLDDAIKKLPCNSIIVLDASSPERHTLALEVAAYLNLRREPLRSAALRFIVFWPIEIKDELLAKAPDLWSMRTLSPWVTNAELVFVESSSENEPIFNDELDDTNFVVKSSTEIEKKLTQWEKHHDLKLADLSDLDAVKLAADLINVRKFSVAIEIADALILSLQRQPITTTTANSIKGRVFNLLSIAHFRIGNSEAALLAAKEVVLIYKRLAADYPTAFEPNFAMSLNNLANRLSETGDRAGALQAATDAVAIYMRLARSSPNAFDSNLAMSLNNKARALNDVGDLAGALLAAQWSVEIRRRLIAVNPAAFEHDLAGSLNNLANALSATGDLTGALRAAQEAIEIRRRLAAANPAAFEHHLAMSLNNLANRLSETGNYANALQAAKEAVEIRRRLAAANAAAFEPFLAGNLSNLANRLSEAGDLAGALLAVKEAVSIRRRLAVANAAAFEPNLAMSVNNLASFLNETGDRAEALAAAKEAVALFESSNKWHKGLFEEHIKRGQALVESLSKQI